MAGLDLTSLLDSVREYAQGIAAGTTMLQKNSAAAQDISNQDAQLYKDIGTSEVLINTVQENAKLATQSAKISIAQKFGTDTNAVGEKITGLSNVIHQQYAEKDAALAEVQKKQSVSFFDDPLSWVVNQFTVQTDIDKAAAADERLKAAHGELQQLNADTQTSAKTAADLEQSVTNATIKAGNDKILALAQLKADQASRQGLIDNSEGVRAALNADKEMNGIAFSIFGAQKQQQQAELALQHLALSKAEFQYRKNKDAEAKTDAAGEESYFISRINRGIELAGGPEAQKITPGTTDAKAAISLLKSGSEAGKEVQKYFELANRFSASGIRSLGATPAETLGTFNTISVKLAPAQEKIKTDILGAAVQAVSSDPMIDKKDKQGVVNAINATAQKILDQQARVVKPGTDNLYEIPPIAALINHSPTVQALPVVQKVIAPAIAAGADLSSPDKVFGTVVAAMKSGKISYNEAIEMTSLYQTGMRTNLESRNFLSFGLVPKMEYNVEVTTRPDSVFKGKSIVDVTKPDQVGRALNTILSQQPLKTQYDPKAELSNLFGGTK